MKVIGLAGRPGSGKSAVASALAKRPGVEWIDLDRLSWDIYSPGTAAFSQLVAAFGRGIVGPDGAIDRKRLAGIVFSDDHARDKLERIVHPAIDERLALLRAEHEKRGTKVLIVEGALLASSPHVDRTTYDAVIWLDAPEGVRMERLRAAGREGHLLRGRGITPSGSAIVIDAVGPVEEVAGRVWDAIASL